MEVSLLKRKDLRKFSGKPGLQSLDCGHNVNVEVPASIWNMKEVRKLLRSSMYNREKPGMKYNSGFSYVTKWISEKVAWLKTS